MNNQSRTYTGGELACAILVTLFLAGGICGFIGFVFGGNTGVDRYISQNCTAYPFLLIDPNKYMACLRP